MNFQKIFCFLLFFSASIFVQATTYFVANSNPCASNSNDGLSIECNATSGPFLSIEHAVSILSDGDSLQIGMGTYFEHPWINGLQNITILAYGNGMVTISGAMPEFTQENNGLWTFEGMRYSDYHEQDFPVYSANYPAGVVPNPLWNNTLVQNTVVDDNGQKIYTYVDSTLFTLRHQPTIDGVYFDFERIYISFADPDKNPNDIALFISRFWDVFLLSGNSQALIDGGPDKLITIDHSARFGMHSQDGSRMTLRNLIIKNGHNTVYSSPSAGSTIVENCEFHGGFNSNWTWTGIKECLGNPIGNQSLSGCYTLPDLSINPNAIDGLVSHESFAILLRADTAFNHIKDNKIEGFFNGIAPLAGKGIIEGNQIWNIFDDAIEPEGIVELTIRNNQIWDAFVCHAGVTTEEGPVYVYENIYCANKEIIYSYDFSNDQVGEIWQARPLKYYGNSLDNPSVNTHFYYNTIYGVVKPLQIGSGGCSPSNFAANSSIFNSIFISENHISSNSGKQADGIELRSNLFHSTGFPIINFACWNGSGDFTNLPTGVNVPGSWTANIQIDPEVQGGVINEVFSYFQLTEGSPARVLNNFVLEEIPIDWPGAFELNQRTNAGALEYGVTSLASFTREKKIQISPNPCEEVAYVQWEQSGIVDISVQNIFGQVLFQQEVKGLRSIELRCAEFKPGLYTVVFKTNEPKQFSKAFLIN